MSKYLGVRRMGKWLWALAVAAVLPVWPSAGQGIGDIIYTVGTTTRDSSGRDWAYILWQATQPGLLTNRAFAVYAKPGEATNSSLYVRTAIVSMQTDARVIEPLLQRAQYVGDHPFRLQEDLSSLFGSFIPAAAITRAEQLSAVIRGSVGDPRRFPNLLLLARHHPGVSLALGLAHAQTIGLGSTTFEVRSFDVAANQDIAVIGRVTVEAGRPVVLPTPGRPVELREKSAMGDLNVRLRWGTPDELRRVSLMQFGYNLYRVSLPYASAQGWGISNTPPMAALLSLTANSPAVAKRVNRTPITPVRPFSMDEASNIVSPGDTNTFFVMDDDGRGRTNYHNYGFTNGAQFIYYAAARDVLGRDGTLSPGTLVTVCDRMPPLPPTAVAVENDYRYLPGPKISQQTLRVNWRQNLRTNDEITAYWIYRWTNLVEFTSLSRYALSNRIGVVAHIKEATNNTFLDPAPGAWGAYGHTFWYSVRAADAAACDVNLSAPAGPAFGVLRDRIGPGAGTGVVSINCLTPQVFYEGSSVAAETGTTDISLLVLCRDVERRFDWAEFVVQATYGNTNLTVATSRLYFNGEDQVATRVRLPRGSRDAKPPQLSEVTALQVSCRAALPSGKVSDFAIGQPAIPATNKVARPVFRAIAKIDRVALTDDSSLCQHHPRGGIGDIGGIKLLIFPPLGAWEYRAFRRVDAGPMTLLAQGPATNIASTIELIENTLPPNGGSICFFLQFLDPNGNPGPITPMKCVECEPSTPLPVPVLAKIRSRGTAASPGMRLSWFCSPYGVERFDVRVARLQESPPDQISSMLVNSGAVPVPVTFTNNGTNIIEANFSTFTSPRIGPAFGDEANFTVDCDIEADKTYAVSVRAIGRGGYPGGYCDVKTFTWVPTNVPGPVVAWPARPLPTASSNAWPSGLLAAHLDPASATPYLAATLFNGNAVLIGQTLLPVTSQVETKRHPARIVGQVLDPNSILLTGTNGQSLFAGVLYRIPVTNSLHPVVSKDVIQVSPLMETVAWQKLIAGSTTNSILHDPFVTVTTVPDAATQTSRLYLWLTDTQPVISGASYRYLFVRFKDNHEIDQIIPSNEVTVP